MDFTKVVRGRQTIRNFLDKPVSKAVLENVIEMGLLAPSHDHRRQWHFIRLTDIHKRIEIVEQCEGLKERAVPVLSQNATLAQKMYSKAIPYQKSMLMDAPELVAICFKMNRQIEDCQNLYQLNSLASVWSCTQNMLLAMAANDLVGVTYIPQNQEVLKSILGLPKAYYVASLLAMGYPALDAKRCQQENITITSRIHLNVFDIDD